MSAPCHAKPRHRAAPAAFPVTAPAAHPALRAGGAGGDAGDRRPVVQRRPPRGGRTLGPAAARDHGAHRGRHQDAHRRRQGCAGGGLPRRRAAASRLGRRRHRRPARALLDRHQHPPQPAQLRLLRRPAGPLLRPDAPCRRFGRTAPAPQRPGRAPAARLQRHPRHVGAGAARNARVRAARAPVVPAWPAGRQQHLVADLHRLPLAGTGDHLRAPRAQRRRATSRRGGHRPAAAAHQRIPAPAGADAERRRHGGRARRPDHRHVGRRPGAARRQRPVHPRARRARRQRPGGRCLSFRARLHRQGQRAAHRRLPQRTGPDHPGRLHPPARRGRPELVGGGGRAARRLHGRHRAQRLALAGAVAAGGAGGHRRGLGGAARGGAHAGPVHRIGAAGGRRPAVAATAREPPG